MGREIADDHRCALQHFPGVRPGTPARNIVRRRGRRLRASGVDAGASPARTACLRLSLAGALRAGLADPARGCQPLGVVMAVLRRRLCAGPRAVHIHPICGDDACVSAPDLSRIACERRPAHPAVYAGDGRVRASGVATRALSCRDARGVRRVCHEVRRDQRRPRRSPPPAGGVQRSFHRRPVANLSKLLRAVVPVREGRDPRDELDLHDGRFLEGDESPDPDRRLSHPAQPADTLHAAASRGVSLSAAGCQPGSRKVRHRSCPRVGADGCTHRRLRRRLAARAANVVRNVAGKGGVPRTVRLDDRAIRRILSGLSDRVSQ